MSARAQNHMNHKVLFGDDREIFVMIKEDNLEFDNILLQLRSKQADLLRSCSKILSNSKLSSLIIKKI